MEVNFLMNILFPLISNKFSKFEIFEVIIPNIFFNDSNIMYSKLNGIPKYLAINNVDRIFIELDNFNEEALYLDLSKNRIPIHSFDQGGCALSLLNEDNNGIRQFCNYSIVFSPLKADIRHISGGSYLLTEIKSVKQICPNIENSTFRNMIEEIIYINSSQILFKQRCKCDLVVNTLLFPARYAECSAISEHNIRFIMNLGVSLFFNELSTNLMNFSQLLHEKVELIHREVKLNFDETSNRKDPVVVSLEKLSNELQAGREIFIDNNEVTFVHPNKNTFGPNLLAMSKYASWIGMTAMIIAGGILTFVLRKHQALAKIVSLLMASSKANGLTIPLYTPEPEQITNCVYSLTKLEIALLVMLAIVLCVTMAYIIFRMV